MPLITLLESMLKRVINQFIITPRGKKGVCVNWDFINFGIRLYQPYVGIGLNNTIISLNNVIFNVDVGKVILCTKVLVN